MKVIDLLNKIANGEDVPEHIKIDNCNWNFIKSENNYYDDKNYGYLNWDYFVEKNKLNDEVEIIEENKKVSKIDQHDTQWHYYYTKKEITQQIEDNIEHLRQKVNQIIDELNKLKENRK